MRLELRGRQVILCGKLDLSYTVSIDDWLMHENELYLLYERSSES